MKNNMIDFQEWQNYKFKPAENAIFEYLDDKVVVLNSASENYYTFNSVGTEIWKSLLGNNSLFDTYNLITEEYDVEPMLLKEDIEALMAKIIKFGLGEFVKVG